ERLPKRTRDELLKLTPEQRADKVAALREKERQERLEWPSSRPSQPLPERRRQPVRLTDFTPDVKAFHDERLAPLLTSEAKERLRKAEGLWPVYARTLVELADKHPISRPGPTAGPTKFEDLPREVKLKLNRKALLDAGQPKLWNRMHQAEGKWPDYGTAVA